MRLFIAFTKITGFLVQKICFKSKIYYEDKKIQSRKIKGKAIIVSNHTSVYDFAVMLFVFFWRTLRYQMAEILFKKKLLRLFLKGMGGIFIDRYSHDFSHLKTSLDVLDKGGVVGIFPEGRLPKEGEEAPLPFNEGAVYLALKSGAPVIPVYTSGVYFKRERAKVVIGKPINVSSLVDPAKTDRENLKNVSAYLREKVITLGKIIEPEKTK